jgi:hypothetical protein
MRSSKPSDVSGHFIVRLASLFGKMVFATSSFFCTSVRYVRFIVWALLAWHCIMMYNEVMMCNYVLRSLQLWLSNFVVPHGATSSLFSIFSLPSASCLHCKTCKQCLIWLCMGDLLCLHISKSDVNALLTLRSSYYVIILYLKLLFTTCCH